MTDSFYTPKVLADKLVSYINKDTIYTNVVDFCVGDGELLRAAEERWPGIECFGSDISIDAIKKTKERHSTWVLSTFDFLNEKARKSSKLLQKRKLFDLLLLNPPFSCSGGTLNSCEFDGHSFRTSTSMKFIIESLSFLAPTGKLYAILPLSVAYSQKDREVWGFLERRFNLTILEETTTNYFKDCTPNIVLVSLNDNKKVSNRASIIRSEASFPGLRIFRGKISMHEVNMYPGEYNLIHTTNLQQNKVQDISFNVGRLNSVVQGPAVILPRVGKPNFTKVCILKSNEIYCLSDCILAIQCESDDVALTLFAFLFNHWDEISKLYRGTGAHYITTERLEQYFNLDLSSQGRKVLVNR